MVFDADGDGIDDVLRTGFTGCRVDFGDGAGGWESISYSNGLVDLFGFCLFDEFQEWMRVLIPCDCNGDGRYEYITYSITEEENDCFPRACFAFEFQEGASPREGQYALTTLMEDCGQIYNSFSSRIAVTTGDFNGDGRTDILQNRIYSLTVSLIEDDCHFSYFGGFQSFFPASIRVGNFNGDAFDDYTYIDELNVGMVVEVVYGGISGITLRGYWWGTGTGDELWPICVADFDNDGLDDIALQKYDIGTDDFFTVHIHYSEGDAFLTRCDTLMLQASDWDELDRLRFYASDFNSDGRDDLLYFVAPDTIGVLLQQGPVATFLQRFAVTLDGCWAARLEWEVSGAGDCESFSIGRSAGDEPFTPIGSVAADPLEENYSYIDNDISSLSGLDVTYRLEAINTDGSTAILAERDVTVPRAELALHQNYPNPFNPGTVLSFTLPERAAVTLDIYDVSGRLVRRLVEGEEMEAGLREFHWDGNNDAGRSVSSGIYYCRLTAGKATVTRKLVLMR